MKQLLILFLLLASVVGKSQQSKEEDTLALLFSNIHKIESCGKNFYTSVDNEPSLKQPIESAFAKIDLKKYSSEMYCSFTIGCEINCNGEVGNWTIGIFSEGLDTECLALTKEVAKSLEAISKIAPCTWEKKPVNYRKQRIPIKVSDGKITTRF